MAQTQESYKQRGRLPRYTTKLNAFNAGMYLTNQIEPEGYAKLMVNYDIDATGTHIRPKKGRKLLQALNPALSVYNGMLEQPDLEPILNDHLYVGDSELDDAIAEDVILTRGGTILKYDKDSNNFKFVGYTSTVIPEFAVSSCYAFNKPIGTPGLGVTRTLGTVVNNTYYTITDEGLSKLVLVTNGGYFEKIEPRELNPYEGASSGFNMLLEDPYYFKDVQGGSFNVLGLIPYRPDEQTKPVVSPILGEEIYIKVSYQYPEAGKDLEYSFKYFNLDSGLEEADESNWETIGEGGFKTGEDWWVYTTAKYNNMLVKVTAKITDDATSEVVAMYTFHCGQNMSDMELKNIDLNTGTKMCSWFKYLGIYGVPNAKDTIFFSYAEAPSYFPYPSNTIQFDNEVLAVHNYLDYLLVITVDSIWLVTIGDSIMNSTMKRVMENIYIPEIDALNLVVLKDQIFFKTADQFYVLKPNNYTSDATDLKNYVISTAIDNFTSNFEEEVLKLLNTVYKTKLQEMTIQHRAEIKIENVSITDVYSDVLDEDVHYIYKLSTSFTNDATLKLEDLFYMPMSINLHLVYNTTTRAWRIYLKTLKGNYVDSEGITVDYTGALGTLSRIHYKNKQNGKYYEFFTMRYPNAINNPIYFYQYTQADVDTVGELTQEGTVSYDIKETDPVEYKKYYSLLSGIKITPRDYRQIKTAVDEYEGYLAGTLSITTEEFNVYNKFENTLLVVELTNDSKTDNIPYIDIQEKLAEQNSLYYKKEYDDTRLQNLNLTEFYDSYTYLDTGNIAIDDSFTKRFREVQFNILNEEKELLPFYVDFKLDGMERIHATHYEIQHITDEEDPDYGLIYVTPIEQADLKMYVAPVEATNLRVYGLTATADTVDQSNFWALDLSQFPELAMITVRFTLQGRGRHASLQLLNTSLKSYELSDLNWVYRVMNAR